MEQILTQITNYIDPAMLIVVAALWFIGYGLKQTPRVPNWSVLWIIVLLGIVFGLMVVGINVTGVIQGIIAAALAVLGHQIVKQTKIGMEDDKPPP